MAKFKFLPILFLALLCSCSRGGHREERIVKTTIVDKEIAFEEAIRKYRKRTRIVIDPGHGGDDLGTQSLTAPKQQEKSLNLLVAELLDEQLRRAGYTTIMTRSQDVFIPLKQRAEIANQENANLFVSVHFNAAKNQSAHGIEVFYYNSDKNPGRTEKSKLFAQNVLDRLIQSTQAKSRGVKHGNYAVIRETKMPAILIESGFLTNEAEAEKIRNPDYLKTLASSIAQGVRDHLKG